jgi:uncharacterized ubiquitin-like protein YukD
MGAHGPGGYMGAQGAGGGMYLPLLKEPKIGITVKKGDKVFNLEIRPYKTMREMKMKLYEMTDVPVRQQMLICLDRNKLLDAGDNFQLRDHGIAAGARLYMGVYTGHSQSTSGSDHACTCICCKETQS